ncbi:MAG: cyclic nucleotide-binding domain-containing protein [Oligoflexia bacterium]|nr:cyclic nucleotide-binding domain-containing protein [Oligoflexia bacterium]
MSEPKKIETRTLQTGDVLLKPGDRVTSVYVVQSGRLGVFQNRGEQLVEITQLTAPECLGEEVAFGPQVWSLQVTAIRPTVVVEIPASMIPEQIKATPPHTRDLIKSLNERSKALFSELRVFRGDQGATACPADETAKVFAIIFHTLRSVGQLEKNGENESATAPWRELLRFARDIFQESEARLESAVQILIRLGYATFSKDAAGAEKIFVRSMRTLEDFVDYYGGYHFKGGYSNLLKTNAKMTRITEEAVKLANNSELGAKVDRAGVVYLPYKAAIDAMKSAIPGFEADQLFRLEQKGLFVKRVATNDGGVLSFLKMDFEQMLRNWTLLREVEIWNEAGYVQPAQDLSVVLDPKMERERFKQLLAHWKPIASAAGGPPKIRTGPKKMGEIWCGVCMSVCKPKQKNCEVCGAEIKSEAA